ncbi:TetR family transcriptional regulator [Rhodococcus sp. IEGM 1307]|uniref:TetR family transcriptional regulator n=1 Tax=Rhodococcus sp. IEGM 1307 TaxID=3047091 RepID=UPI0024B874D0|nr:TetR family transcriptional regulator [Rhodococcus sp. IEGM 1307]MDI9979533.1 TetR family transcriptional regulator [Rhodococcus sp. IEGM 1307]
MDDSETKPGLVRDIARDAVRAHVTAVAVHLFDELGFENVTIDQLSEAAGISRRTFHRYFSAKEDVIVGDTAQMGKLVRDALLQRPPQEPVWTSLRLAFVYMLSQASGDSARGKRMIRLMADTAALRARNLEKHLKWENMLTPIIEERLTGDDRHVRAQALVHAGLACLDVSLLTWAQSTSDSGIEDVFRRVFAAIDEGG